MSISDELLDDLEQQAIEGSIRSAIISAYVAGRQSHADEEFRKARESWQRAGLAPELVQTVSVQPNPSGVPVGGTGGATGDETTRPESKP